MHENFTLGSLNKRKIACLLDTKFIRGPLITSQKKKKHYAFKVSGGKKSYHYRHKTEDPQTLISSYSFYLEKHTYTCV